MPRFKSATSAVVGVAPVWLPYDRESAIGPSVLAAQADVDAFCFSGDVPAERARDAGLPTDVPTTTVELTAVDVALCFARAMQAGHAIGPVSIDTATTEIVDELTDQLGIESHEVAHLDHSRGLPVDDVIAFHQQAHQRLDTVLAITGRGDALDALNEHLGVPVQAAVPVESSIRAAVREAVIAAGSRRSEDKSFSAAILRVIGDSDLLAAEARRLAIAQALHGVAELSDAWVETRSGGSDVLIFGHRRLMQRLTHTWNNIPLLRDLEQAVRLPVACGIGIGGSARRSVELAEAALQRSVRAGGRCGFVVTGDGAVVGPLGTTAADGSQRYRYHTEDDEIVALARKLRFGVPTLSRLIGVEEELAGESVTAADLAKALNMSAPSGRRIARTLQQHGLMARVGATQPAGRGRPTSLFRLEIRQQRRRSST